MKRILRGSWPTFTSGLLILLLCGSCSLRAQKGQKEDILKAQEKVNARIDRCLKEGSPCGLYYNRILTNPGNEPWPAVGNFKSTTDLWYVRDQNSEEESYQQVKVNATTQRSSRREKEEYIYSSKGQLQFYHFRMTEGDAALQEYWYYFSNGELLEYQETVAPKEVKYKLWSREDAKKALEKAKDLQELLQATL